MRKWLLVAILAAGFVMIFAGVASADNGPHIGDFNSTTDACAGCHRAHRGSGPKLLVEASEYDLCMTCHGGVGSGADTNVLDGVYTGSTEGTLNAGLKGGGFTNVLMDVAPDPGVSTPSIAAVTSKHNVGELGTIWGNGAINSGAGTPLAAALQCSSCHNPHGISGGDRYRILRDIPKESGVGTWIGVADEGTKDYTVSYVSTSHYRDTLYVGGASQDIAQWCATCHTRYMGGGAAGDAIFNYRHETAGDPTLLLEDTDCLSCHVAHGSSASMAGDGTTTYSASVEWPDATTVDPLANSRLLQVNNRGICYKCHPTAEIP